MTVSVNDVASIYANPGYMDPQDFEELAQAYGRSRRWVICEGTLLDSQVLFDTDMTGMPINERPTVIVRPITVNTWTSTYQARAWEYADTPQQVWNLIDFVENNDEALATGDTRALENVYVMLDEIFSM